MTPQERALMAQLFDRLATLESAPRDPDAEAMIREGFRRAPNAAYALVQTVLLQDEALKAANAHIQQYEQSTGTPQQANEPPRNFLDSMRDNLFGREEPRGSVPRVPQSGAPVGAPGDRPDPWGRGQGGSQQGSYQQGGYQQGAPMQAPPPPSGGGGGSFLGTAAAAAAGMIGGSLLMGGIRSALGGHSGGSPASGAFDSLTGRGEGAPSGGNAAGSDLARDAGLGDIGGRSGSGGGAQRAGLFDSKQDDSEGDSDVDDSVDDGDSFDSGATDTA
ncbi:MAG: uncharacterized protein QOF14_5085 [Hyphomicrobiales bacterium]|jgi:hypothetical protein|nr:uncharacterized protein [Hyphomicrobiales bacterium]